MEEITNLVLLRQFRQCAHLQYHRYTKYQGQGRILILLTERGTLTQRELIEITQRRSATLSEQLEQMETAGWITRSKNSEDRRNVNLCLTESGKLAAGEAEREREQTANVLFSVLGAEEKRQLSHVLVVLEQAWQKAQSGLPQENTVPGEKPGEPGRGGCAQ